MTEAEVIARSVDGPVTRARLVADLRRLGVEPGMILIAHTSLSALGWVIGGAETVVDALREAVGPDGTLVMPAFSSGNSDPADWQHPPVPASWHDAIRAEMPAYDPATTPTRGIGRVTEFFRALPGVVRSAHPSTSVAALGPRAEELTSSHALEDAFGADSPMARCLAAGAEVLSMGTQRTSILHHAEHLARWPSKRTTRQGAAARVDGERRWLTWEESDWLDDDFETLRQAYMETPGPWSAGPIGYGSGRRFAAAPLVTFAVAWIERHRD